MQTTAPIPFAQRPWVSRKALVARYHAHPGLQSDQHAGQIKSGTLDIQLLQDALLHVPDALQSNAEVFVRFEHMAYNAFADRCEPIYAVSDAQGDFQGHYFSSAFASLRQ